MNKTIEMPSDATAEIYLLSSFFNSISCWNEYAYQLSVEDFYLPSNRKIFHELKQLTNHSERVDISYFIKKMNDLDFIKECGGNNYIVQVSVQYTPGMAVNEYFKIVKNASNLRKMIYFSKNIIDKCSSNQSNSEEIIHDSHKNLFDIEGVKANKTKTPEEIFKSYSEHGTFEEHSAWMQNQVKNGRPCYTGVESGYQILDRTLGFFRKRCLYYIGARTSMGKTTFALNLINGMLSKKKDLKIGVFSLEMDASILITKILCIQCGILFSDYEDGLLSPEQFNKIHKKSLEFSKSKIYLEDEEDMSISRLRSRCRRLKQNYDIDVVFIDYLTRIKADTKNLTMHLQVNEISKGLQSMAKELDIPVICLAQLNRATVGRSDPTPTLSDFRESGSIEEDADAVILLHRPDYFDPNSYPGQIQVILGKNRIRGQVKKIAFCKPKESELYIEQNTITEELNKINKRKSYKEEMEVEV